MTIPKAFMMADVRLGSKYVSEVFLDLKGQGFLSWKEKSQKIENVKGIAHPWCNKHNFLYTFSLCRHFSHVTKSRIFKNLNLRKKADRHFHGNFLKNYFRHLKLYSNPPSWLARSRCHMGTFWKKKDWSSHFWEGQPFRFWYVEVHLQRRFKSTKTGISS